MMIDYLLLGIAIGIVFGYFLGCKEGDKLLEIQDTYIKYLEDTVRELEEMLLKKKKK